MFGVPNITEKSISYQQHINDESVRIETVVQSSDLAEGLSAGRRRQPQRRSKKVEGDRPAGKVPNQDSIPPVEALSNVRQRRRQQKSQMHSDLAETTRFGSGVLENSNSEKLNRELVNKSNSSLKEFRNIEDDGPEEKASNQDCVPPIKRRRNKIRNYTNKDQALLLSDLKKKIEQAKRQQIQSAGKIYKDLKIIEISPTKVEK